MRGSMRGRLEVEGLEAGGAGERRRGLIMRLAEREFSRGVRPLGNAVNVGRYRNLTWSRAATALRSVESTSRSLQARPSAWAATRNCPPPRDRPHGCRGRFAQSSSPVAPGDFRPDLGAFCCSAPWGQTGRNEKSIVRLEQKASRTPPSHSLLRENPHPASLDIQVDGVRSSLGCQVKTTRSSSCRARSI